MRPTLAALLLAALLVGLAPAGLRAQPATPEATPPERCLALETFAVPAGDAPHDVAPAADGVGVWYTGQGSGVLGLLDPATGEVERVPLGAGSAPHGVIVGPDGAAWVTDGGLDAVVRVDAETLAVTPFPLPPQWAGANLNTAAFGADGVLWFTGQTGIVGRVHHDTGEVRAWGVPGGQGPYGITATPDDAVFFVSLGGNYLGRVHESVYGTTRRFSVDIFDAPTPDAGPRRVWSDSHGALWISEWTAGRLARFDPATLTASPATLSWEEWPLPGAAPQAYAVYVDDRDDVWLSDFAANTLVRFDPDTETFASLLLPDPAAAVRQLHGRPGEVWGAESAADKLVVVRTTC